MVQSSLSQPFTSKTKRKYFDLWELNPDEIEAIGKDGRESIQFMEGLLIKAWKMKNGNLPKWNQMGASVLGQIRAKPEDSKLTERFTDTKPNENASRASLRELATQNLFNMFELYIHGVIRINPLPAEIAIRMNEPLIYDEIMKTKYLQKVLTI